MSRDDFETSDIYLAAALVATGVRPRRLNARGPKTVFAFERSSEVGSLVARFYEAALQIDALQYSEAIRSTKAAAMNVAGRGGS